MNVERLIGLAEVMLATERAESLRAIFNNLVDTLNNLVNSGSSPQHQQEFSNSLNNFKNKLTNSKLNDLTAGQMALAAEIGGADLYGKRLASDVAKIIADNQLTPSVALGLLGPLRDKHNGFFGSLEGLVGSTKALGLNSEAISPGKAEVGFLIPKALYNESLPKLIVELQFLHRALPFIIESELGEVPEIRLGHIAASDPAFFMEASTQAVMAVGGAITWALATYKQFLEIKKLKIEMEKASGPSAKTVASLQSDIDNYIKAAVDARVTEVMAQDKIAEQGRRNEVSQGLAWALESLLARIDRGMTVEIRALPPKAASEKDADEVKIKIAEETTKIAEIHEVAKSLTFPSRSDPPVLSLPPPEPDEEQAGAPVVKAKRK